tara:strand:+ start:279076 stop:283374 length:4299 start_codon:yes stop_codon:yes gene_type:complete
MPDKKYFKASYQKALEHLQAEGIITNSDLLSMCDDDESVAEAIRQNLIVNNLAKEHDSGYGLVYAGKETVNEPKEIPQLKIFLSYGRKDASDIARTLKQTLENEGHTVWIDEAEMKGGRSWEEQIEQAIKGADRVITVLSPHAVRRPEGVCLDEISFARFRGIPIIPVMYKPCTPPLSIFRLDWIDLKNVDQLNNLEERLSKLRQALASGGRLSVEGALAGLMGQLNPIDFGPELAALQHDFTGRKWLVDEIDQWLGDKDGDAVCLITGDPGAGKSAALAHLAHKLSNVAAIHFCRSVDSQTTDPERFIKSLAAQLATQLPDYAEALEGVLHDPDLFNEKPDALFKNLIINPLTSVTIDENNTPALLLVDGLDEALQSPSDQTIPKLLGSFLRELTLAKDLRLLLASRPVAGVMRYFTGRTHRINIDASSENNRDDIQQYIEYKLEGGSIQKVLEQTGTDRQTVKEWLEEKAGGNFLYAEKAIEAIEKGTLDPSQPDQFPVGLTGLYQAFFERHFSDLEAYEKEVRPLLEIIVAAQEPVSGQRMVAALSASDMLEKVGLDPIDPEFELNRRLHKLSAMFPNADGQYRPYHLSVAEWLAGDSNKTYNEIKFGVSPIRGHHRMADGGLRSWDTEKENLDSYDLKYLPTHLQQAGRWDELYELLTNFEYVDLKARSNMVQELAEDFKQAARQYREDRNNKKTVLSVLSRAINSEIQFIMRHPDLLFQVCWNRGWWYDAPETAIYSGITNAAPEDYQPPWKREGQQAHSLLESWKSHFKAKNSSKPWVKELIPSHDIFNINNRTFRGHERIITHLAWSPSGYRLATASWDCTARIWDPDGQAEPIILKGHKSLVTHLAWSPSGSRLATASGDGTARIWATTGKAEPIILKGHKSSVDHLAWSPTGDRLATASDDGTARIWYPDRQSETLILEGHKMSITNLAWSPTGDRLATASWDGTARIWATTGTAEPIILKGHKSSVTHLAWSPSGDRLATASLDGSIRVYDLDSKSKPLILKKYKDRLTFLAWSPDGTRLATISDDGSMKFNRNVRIWNLLDGMNLQLINEGTGFTCLAWSSDGNSLAAASRDCLIRIWNVEIEYEPLIVKNHEISVECVVWSPTGDHLASASWDGTARIWNPEGESEPLVLKAHVMRVTHLAWSPTGDRLATGSGDGTASIWDPEGQVEPVILKGHEEWVQHLAWSPSGDRLATASNDGTARIWDSDGRDEPIVLKGHEDWVDHLSWSPSGDRLATASGDGTARIWDSDGKAKPIILEVNKKPVYYLAWSPSGGHLATVSNDGTARIWDPAGKSEPIVLKGHIGSGINYLVWSPSGDRVATASFDGTARIWDLSKAEIPYTIHEHIYPEQLRALLENDSNLTDRHFIGYQDGSDMQLKKGEQICFYEKSNIEILKQSSTKNLWAGYSGSSVVIFKIENERE